MSSSARAAALAGIPIPISTPGFDNAPYTTAGHWVTKDPETGMHNLGNYRGMVKAEDRIGVLLGPARTGACAITSTAGASAAPSACRPRS